MNLLNNNKEGRDNVDLATEIMLRNEHFLLIAVRHNDESGKLFYDVYSDDQLVEDNLVAYWSTIRDKEMNEFLNNTNEDGHS